MIRLLSRSKIRQQNNLGIIPLEMGKKVQIFRDKKLDKLDQYYDCTQYDKLPSWDTDVDTAGNSIPPRQRKPRINMAFAKTLSKRLAAKIVGASVFPNFKIENSPDDQAFFKAVVREAKLKSRLIEPVRRALNTGSVLVRFYLIDGSLKVEWYHSKFCYPEFLPSGDLKSVVIKYLFDDENDKDDKGAPKKKWFRMDLLMDREILYDNPEYKENAEPEFSVVADVKHDLGFVQAEWLRTCEEREKPDGYGLTSDLMEFIDEMNYSISQSSQAVGFNQDPQLALKGLSQDEMSELIRSSARSWNLGMHGEAEFLETNMSGVERAIELRDKVRQSIQDISRIVILDPEKVVGNAQSAKAMEALHGPLMELVDELRLPFGDSIRNIVLKLGVIVLIAEQRGLPIPIAMPAGYRPKSMDIEVDWPPIFQQTIEDLQKKVALVTAAHMGRVISQETAVKYIAKDFGVEDVEAELSAIAAEPPPNPFGGF